MEIGARFLKCDLHMHTHADPAGWIGVSMGATLPEWKEAATQYIRQCYEQGLDLIAITDHNFASKEFLPLLRNAAAELSQEYGYGLTIMAGFEMLADVGRGVHVLAVFDPSIPDSDIDHIMTQCGVPVQRFEFGAPAPTRSKLSDILKIVQTPRPQGIQGVVIFPHCQSDAGIFDNDRLSDWLQQDEYRNPDLLAVEVSKPVDQMSAAWQRLFESGETCLPDWCRSRALACIMSSDAKTYGDKNMANNIGFRYTWIKLAQPTAEGLRQAFLAHKSRIRLSNPNIPSVYISEMTVSACKFFTDRPFKVHFNRQFNAIIGGRGTGKSTILEYLRWALHDEPPILGDDETEVPQYAKNRGKIIKETLQQQTGDAYVSVIFVVNGTPHVVTRYVRTDRTTIKIGDTPEQETNGEELSHLISLQAYSQKQLSTIAVRIDELRGLVESPLKDILRVFNEEIVDLRQAIQEFFTKRSKVQTLEARIRSDEAELSSKKAQIESLKGEITNLLPEDQLTLNIHQAHLTEQQVITGIEEDYESLGSVFQSALDELAAIPRVHSVAEDSPQPDKIATLLEGIVQAKNAAVHQIQLAQTEFNVTRETFGAQKLEWLIGLDEHAAKFAQAKERAKVHRHRLDQIETLSQEVQKLALHIEALGVEKADLNFDPTNEEENNQRWIALHRDRGDLIEEACRHLTAQSGGDIRAELRRGADAKEAFDQLRERLGGSRTRQDWLDNLNRRVIEAVNPAEEWTRVMREFRLLAEIPSDQVQGINMPECPYLSAAGFNAQALQRIASHLEMDSWLEILLISLEDKPEFFFRLESSAEIRFESASPGQQATALLTVLLNQSGGPLVIDQPEDDLDNAIINKIVETIWVAKEKRQLIFTSHNANLVVNGDAELVIACNYCSTESRSAGRIECAGSIEEAATRTAIKAVMEGGEKAFELRKAKYGF